MKAVKISLEDVADINNLAVAAHKAARAKHHRSSVQHFFKDLNTNLSKLSKDILAKSVPYGHYKSFSIRDPKPRIIHAACFEDRVLHHALMNYVGPILDKSMTTSSFACREGYGVHSAAQYALKCVRGYPYFLKLDVKAYFASIPHVQLLDVLKRKLKGQDVIALITRIIQSYKTPIIYGQEINYGLPIGALCSQHFANYYLDSVDRALLAHPKVAKSLRYMDDILVFCKSKEDAKVMQRFAKACLEAKGLTLKESWQLNRTSCGVTFCGYRIMPQGLGLSSRRRQRYQKRRLYWEQQYREGRISASELQRAGAAVQSIVQGSSTNWSQRNLLIHPPVDA